MLTTELAADALSTMSAKDYALLRNAERNAQAKAEGWSFWTTYPTDDDYWAEMAAEGVTTAADLVRRNAIATHSDVYKDVHGIRPRWVRYEELSTEQIQDMIDRL